MTPVAVRRASQQRGIDALTEQLLRRYHVLDNLGAKIKFLVVNLALCFSRNLQVVLLITGSQLLTRVSVCQDSHRLRQATLGTGYQGKCARAH